MSPPRITRTFNIPPNLRLEAASLEVAERPPLKGTRISTMLREIGSQWPNAGILRPYIPCVAKLKTLDPLPAALDLQDNQPTGLGEAELQQLQVPSRSSLPGISPLTELAAHSLVIQDINSESQSDPGGVMPFCQHDTWITPDGQQQVLRFDHSQQTSRANQDVLSRKLSKKEALEHMFNSIRDRLLFNGIGISPEDPTFAQFFDLLSQLRTSHFRMNTWGMKELPKELGPVLSQLSEFSGDTSLLIRENPRLLKILGHFYYSPDACREQILRGIEMIGSTPNILIVGPSSGGKTTLLHHVQGVLKFVSNFGSSKEGNPQGSIQMRENKFAHFTNVQALTPRACFPEADRPISIIREGYQQGNGSSQLNVIETPAPVSLSSISAHGGLKRALLLSYPEYGSVEDLLADQLGAMDPDALLIPTIIMGLLDGSRGILHPIPDTPESYNQLVVDFLGSLNLFLPDKYFDPEARYSVNDAEVQDVMSINFSMIIKALPRTIGDMLSLGMVTRRPFQPIFVPANSEAPLSPIINHRNYGLLHLLAVLNNFGALALGTNVNKLPILGRKIFKDITIGINASGNFNLRDIVAAMPEMDSEIGSKMDQLKKFATFLEKTSSTGKELAQSLYGLIISIHELYYFHNDTQRKIAQKPQ